MIGMVYLFREGKGIRMSPRSKTVTDDQILVSAFESAVKKILFTADSVYKPELSEVGGICGVQ